MREILKKKFEDLTLKDIMQLFEMGKVADDDFFELQEIVQVIQDIDLKKEIVVEV